VTLNGILTTATFDYIYGPTGTPVEQIALSTSTPTYLTYTQSDDTWLSTNTAGDQTGYWGYDAYGTLAYGTPTSPFGYSGQYTDATTGLVNDRARYYSSQTGGFTTRDPAFAQTNTAYTYANQDPVNNSDPTGLCVKILWQCIGNGGETSSIGFGFHPFAARQAVINLADGFLGIGSSGTSCNPLQNIPYYVGNLVPFGILSILGASDSLGPPDDEQPPDEPSVSPEEEGPPSAYHYTYSQYVASIEQTGLRAGSYLTPTGNLSALQAQLELALPPNSGLPDAQIEVDLAGLRQAGYDIPPITRVTNVVQGANGRVYSMPGGGYEMYFSYVIPPQFIKSVSP
jgi:RHS repeat-associated protein